VDTKQFIASLVSSLAWPTAAVLITLVFREQLAKLLSAPLKRLKAGPSGIELEFDLELERAVTKAEAEIEPAALPSLPEEAPLPLVDDLRAVAQKEPQTAVLAASSRFERQLRDLLRDSGDPEAASAKRGMVWLARRAVEKGLIQENLAGLIQALATLRNIAAHGEEESPDVQGAMNFLSLLAEVSVAVEHSARRSES
jgi:hypothetical protein